MLEKAIVEIFKKHKGTKNVSVLLYAHFPIALGLRPCAQVEWLDFEPKKKSDEMHEIAPGHVRMEIWSEEEENIGNKLALKYVPYMPIIRGSRNAATRRYYAVPAANTSLIGRIQSSPDAEEDVELQGRLHEYPQDCVQEFSNDSGLRLMPELRANEQLLHAKEKGKPIEPFAYFAKGFIPCKPSCKNAAAIGRKIHNAYSSINKELAKAYANFVKQHVADLERTDVKTVYDFAFGKMDS